MAAFFTGPPSYISKDRLILTLKSRFSCERSSFQCCCDCWCLPDFGHSHEYKHFTQFWVLVHEPVFRLPSKTYLKALNSLSCIPRRSQLSFSSEAVILTLEYAKHGDIQGYPRDEQDLTISINNLQEITVFLKDVKEISFNITIRQAKQ